MGTDQGLGFALYARRRIPEGAIIWEGIGMCPGDSNCPHSDLSCITIAPGQNQPAGSERILYGPLRMVNHRCQTFNAQVRVPLL